MELGTRPSVFSLPSCQTLDSEAFIKHGQNASLQMPLSVQASALEFITPRLPS